MGRLYQLFAFFSVLCVLNYVRTECRGLRYNKALMIATFTTLFFVVIGYKHLSVPHLTYLFIGLVGIPSIIYGVMYDPNILLIIAATYIPFNLLLPADFGGFQKAFNGTNVVLVALFLGYLLGKKRSPDETSPRTKWVMRLLVLYTLLSLISFIRGGLFYGISYVMRFAFPLKRWLTPMILMVLFYKMLRGREMIKIIFAIFMIVVIANIFYGILEWVDLGFATYSTFKRRLGALNSAPNAYGAFLAYYLCLIIAPFLTSFRKSSAKFLIFPVLIGLRIIIPTNSRGAWISLPPALLTVTFFKNKLLFLMAGISVIVAILFFPILIPDTVKMRMEGAIGRKEHSGIYVEEASSPLGYLAESKSVSMRSRAILLEGGLKMARLDPWFGLGWGTFPHFISAYTEGGLRGTAHNMLLRILCEMGLITLLTLAVLMISMFGYGVYVFRREKDTMLKGMALGYIASIPAIVVCNLTGNRFDSVDLISIFWILSACVLRLKDIIHYERIELR